MKAFSSAGTGAMGLQEQGIAPAGTMSQSCVAARLLQVDVPHWVLHHLSAQCSVLPCEGIVLIIYCFLI